MLDECKNHDCALLDNKLTIIYTHPVSLELPEELSPIFAISISKLDGIVLKCKPKVFNT